MDEQTRVYENNCIYGRKNHCVEVHMQHLGQIFTFTFLGFPLYLSLLSPQIYLDIIY